MEIKSKMLGQQQVDPETIIQFPEGIPGFEDQKRFKLFHKEGSSVLYWLQSIDNEDLTFSVTLPTQFSINYSFVLTDREQQILALDNMDELIILILLHTDEDKKENGKPVIKGSIKSPLLINGSKRIGLQKVLVKVEQSIILSEPSNEIDVAEITD